MPDRAGQFLKIICCALMLLVVCKLVGVASRVNPLSHVVIPDLPTLASNKDTKTNAPTGATGTNSTSAAKATNILATAKTNSPAIKSTNDIGTNLVVAAAPTPTEEAHSTKNEKSQTNSAVAIVSTNTATVVTNATASAPAEDEGETTKLSATTNTPSMPISSNRFVSNAIIGGKTNLGTNALALAKLKRRGTNVGSLPPRMSSRMGGNMRGAAALPELPPDIKARIDRVYESEILAQVMRPLPMGLIGIAGDVAFLRTANGQTGLIKEGDTLGDLKLLRIGINRVLVEQDGQKKELMIFEGYGGQSLMP